MKRLLLAISLMMVCVGTVACDEKPIEPTTPTENPGEGTEDPKDPEPEPEREPDGDPLVAYNATQEAINLYNFLEEQQAADKIISGAMANVHWNINEADWVKHHTGKYPALAAFDYINLHTDWTDYTNTTVVEDWWANNGIVSIAWHWNVPVAGGSDKYAFYTYKDGSGTVFNIANIADTTSWEYRVMIADIHTAADRLLLLKDKGIPVLWRPLHEASGGWFWWGAKGAAPCVELWRLMFDIFDQRGVNNLIWCWTSEVGDDAWYPGDEYVDIITRDKYRVTAEMLGNDYLTLTEKYPNRVVALSEFGDITNDQELLNSPWSWFMPWYDYNRTVNPQSEEFKSEEHIYADATFWRAAVANPRVLFRDHMPSLK